MKIYDFAKYRTVDTITLTIITELPYIQTPDDGIRAECPDPECPGHGHHSFVWKRTWTVAYCHCCHKTYDAIQILILRRGMDHFQACDHLQHIID